MLFGVESLKIQQVFTSTDKDDGCMGSGDSRDGTTTGGSTISLCDDDGTVVGSLLEGSRLSLGGLTDGRIEDHDGLVRRDGLLNLDHLIKKVLLLSVTTRGIDDDDLELLLLELFDTFASDNDGVGLGQTTIVGDLCFGSILLQLVEGTSTEGIGANQGSLEASRLVPAGELGTSSCFTGTLETDEHDDIGFALLGLIRGIVGIDKLDEFIKDGLYGDNYDKIESSCYGCSREGGGWERGREDERANSRAYSSRCLCDRDAGALGGFVEGKSAGRVGQKAADLEPQLPQTLPTKIRKVATKNPSSTSTILFAPHHNTSFTMGNPSAKRKRPEGMGYRKPKKLVKKFKKQKAYHSDSEDDEVQSTNTNTNSDFNPVNMDDSEGEEVEDTPAAPVVPVPAPEPIVEKKTAPKPILGTKLTTSKRQDPVLSRSAAATAASKELADQKLELKAKRKMHAEKREALDKGRVKDVLGLNTPEVSTAQIQETEKRLQKTAQRGVVKLFNAVRAAQVQGEQARSEAKKEGVVGISQREERVSEMSKKGFLDLIATGGKKAAAVEA
ncbi:Rrp15p-domain-containing protein [Aureobasidium pullulans]|uniref:Rrp15p-domain-containing protein n=1 Tax=Aureobasidium pullulans TaxID=5580 RepID=A0A4S9LS97_AURPU|nr:Rrp15p-domain-containing protein [Aureobasidium pullulans]